MMFLFEVTCAFGKICLTKNNINENGCFIQDVNAIAFESETALHLAAANGHHDVVRTLLSKGALVDAEDENSCTPLMFAALGNHPHSVKELLQHGANITRYPDFTKPLPNVVPCLLVFLPKIMEPVVKDHFYIKYFLSKNVIFDEYLTYLTKLPGI